MPDWIKEYERIKAKTLNEKLLFQVFWFYFQLALYLKRGMPYSQLYPKNH